jgi:hypothetical protein
MNAADPDTVHEERIIKKINDIINNPPDMSEGQERYNSSHTFNGSPELLDLSPAHQDEEFLDLNKSATSGQQQGLEDQLRSILAGISAPSESYDIWIYIRFCSTTT